MFLEGGPGRLEEVRGVDGEGFDVCGTGMSGSGPEECGRSWVSETGGGLPAMTSDSCTQG